MPKHVLAKLETDLRNLKQALLVDIPKEIASAASQGDLSENAEYEQALAKRDMYQSKVVSMESASPSFAGHHPASQDRIAYGSKVTLLDLDTAPRSPITWCCRGVGISRISQHQLTMAGRVRGRGAEVGCIPAGTKRYEM